MGKQATECEFDTQIIGAFPVIASFLDKLDFAGLIDANIPWEGEIPLGTLATVLVLNRLLQPTALMRVGEWAEQAGVAQYYGLRAEQLNDDLLGRALERFAAHYVNAQGPLVLAAVKKFDLDVRHIHYDVTGVELYGDYARQTPADGQSLPPGIPQPAYGRTKSGRKNVKQVQFGLNVTHDGGIPVGHLPLDGNAPEAPSHLENFRLLKRTLPSTKLLYCADTKLDTDDNLLALHAAGGQFLCGGVFSAALKQQFLEQRDQLQPVDYAPQSQAKLPPEERDQYQAFEVPQTLTGPVDGRKQTVRYRLVFVWSEGKARQEQATRARHVAKIQREFEAVQRNLNKYSLKTEAAIVRRLEVAKAKYEEGDVFAYELRGKPGAYRLTWRIDPAALARREKLEGVYVLKTDLAKRSYPLAAVLAEYKAQSCVERRIQHCKGPLAVAPVYLEKPARIAGLLCVVVWALLVLGLMERSVRRSLAGEPMYGLYPENRPSPSPTGPSILRAFSTLCVVIVKADGDETRHLAAPTAVQQKLLKLLGVPPGTMQTFARRCGT
jgi:transposase